ncbi:hypothetical protein BDZ90DRAFT_257731 [Jaminaea rosea]|uniref:Uncharacterized protein n=1 Tax=Jaminaea rosea TaxID=1569628 RepID=A0A316V270_9BASI|nr:hypothetical protein BDZ90DRAFT_257731 [Jaminaea rosea]PWN30661.1 hypothetical protein BDZ90DRAFT_257731 [Jaminaea rosea]
MAGRPGPAAILPLEDIRIDHAGAKVRVAGCLVSYDEATSLGLLSHKQATLLVDLTACLQDLRLVDKPMLMLIGDLERFENELPESLHIVEDRVAPPIEDLLLCVHLVKRCDGLDMQVWDEAARMESRARWEHLTAVERT